jgi:uncharacterized protein YacL (UPF0231 family)
MKKIILLFLVLVNINAFAQKEVKEGVMTMKMTMSTDNEQAKAALEMMGDIPMTVYFKGQKSRTEQSHQMTGDNTTIIDNEAKKMLVMLNNPMLGKKYTESDMSTYDEEAKSMTVKANGKTKTVIGYECNGYDITGKKEGVDVNMTMYTTEKILAPTQNTTMLGDKLKGFPMYMTMTMNQPGMGSMIITMEVTGLKDEKVDASKFSMTVPEGYEKMETPKPAKID